MREIKKIFHTLWEETGKSERQAAECFEYLKTFSKILNYKPSESFPRKPKKNTDYEKRYSSIVRELAEEFEKSAGNSFGNLLRTIGAQRKLTYRSILTDCCSELRISTSKKSIIKLEDEITAIFSNEMWEKLNENARRKIRNSIINEVTSKRDKEKMVELFKSSAPFAAIVAGKLSGFGIYLLATTSLHTVASVLGISLGFGFYSSLTSSLGVALGPVGFVIASAWAAYNISSPSYRRKIIPSVILFCAIRKFTSSQEDK